ncbi:MAG: hypothetical protein BMS9Abin12_1969 [Acidimicrobiia bacterium]|nr:MAG: hypothetical protein BMS9Abin12_1969 [Acidimicrobiia bacterium]
MSVVVVPTSLYTPNGADFAAVDGLIDVVETQERHR